MPPRWSLGSSHTHTQPPPQKQDPTGVRVQGCVHTELVEEYGPELAVGAVLLLARVGGSCDYKGGGGGRGVTLGKMLAIFVQPFSSTSHIHHITQHTPALCVLIYPLSHDTHTHTRTHIHTGGHPPKWPGGAALAQHRTRQPPRPVPAPESAGEGAAQGVGGGGGGGGGAVFRHDDGGWVGLWGWGCLEVWRYGPDVGACVYVCVG
jgi:hypothetical protein